jgi:archaellum component FlaD/FlaE
MENIKQVLEYFLDLGWINEKSIPKFRDVSFGIKPLVPL